MRRACADDPTAPLTLRAARARAPLQLGDVRQLALLQLPGYTPPSSPKEEKKADRKKRVTNSVGMPAPPPPPAPPPRALPLQPVVYSTDGGFISGVVPAKRARPVAAAPAKAPTTRRSVATDCDKARRWLPPPWTLCPTPSALDRTRRRAVNPTA